MGSERYPGDFEAFAQLAGGAPGAGLLGPTNAFSAKFMCGLADGLLAATPKPPVLWVRGADDVIVCDNSMYDLGELGSLGSSRAGRVTRSGRRAEGRADQGGAGRNAAAGGRYREVVIDDAGHGQHLEQPQRFLARELHHHLSGG